VIRRDFDRTDFVKKFDAGAENPLAVSSHFDLLTR
jgi:hypothetical protein